MTCGVCGTANRAGRKFCAECGAALVVGCPACGAANDPGDRFCGECGSALAAAAVPVAPPPAAEVRLVSVVFCDLVGYTALSEQRDAEDVRAVLSGYFDAARTVVGRYGGVIEKFIGDAVVAELDRLGYPYWRALAQGDLGEWLRGEGREQEAAAALDEAVATLAGLGARPALRLLGRDAVADRG